MCGASLRLTVSPFVVLVFLGFVVLDLRNSSCIKSLISLLHYHLLHDLTPIKSLEITRARERTGTWERFIQLYGKSTHKAEVHTLRLCIVSALNSVTFTFEPIAVKDSLPQDSAIVTS